MERLSEHKLGRINRKDCFRIGDIQFTAICQTEKIVIQVTSNSEIKRNILNLFSSSERQRIKKKRKKIKSWMHEQNSTAPQQLKVRIDL